MTLVTIKRDVPRFAATSGCSRDALAATARRPRLAHSLLHPSFWQFCPAFAGRYGIMSAPADSDGLATPTICDERADEPVPTHQCSLCGAMCKVFQTPRFSVALVCLVSGIDLVRFGSCDLVCFECLVPTQIIKILNHCLDSPSCIVAESFP